MEADELVSRVMASTHQQGFVAVHVIIEGTEYLLDAVDIANGMKQEFGWIDGVVIKTRPIDQSSVSRESQPTHPYPFPWLTLSHGEQQTSGQEEGIDPPVRKQIGEHEPVDPHSIGKKMGGHEHTNERQQ
jgi:hypothetical protein